jgi:predicted ATP-grasp superfamily ATP-dependent carboligase
VALGEGATVDCAGAIVTGTNRIALAVARSLGRRGIPRAGRAKLLDANARGWTCLALGGRAGVDFPYLLSGSACRGDAASRGAHRLDQTMQQRRAAAGRRPRR